jgi:hypothetical protein
MQIHVGCLLASRASSALPSLAAADAAARHHQLQGVRWLTRNQLLRGGRKDPDPPNKRKALKGGCMRGSPEQHDEEWGGGGGGEGGAMPCVVVARGRGVQGVG